MFDPSNPRLKINSDYLAALAVTLVPIFYFMPAMLRGVALCPGDGFLQNVPFRIAAANIFRSGSFPLWNPYLFSGMPLLGTAQGGILFPLNWFYLLFSGPRATNLMVVASYMLAALGAYLYARRIRSSIAGAIATSMTWAIGGTLIAQISHINIVHTAALLPWILWALERYVENGSRRRGALIAILFAFQLFAGHPQSFVYSSLLVAAYALVMAFEDRNKTRRYLFSLAFMGVGLLLAAVQILPTWELLRNSLRSTATYEFFTSFSMPIEFLKALLVPYIMGGGDGRLFSAPFVGQQFYTEFISYVGVLGVMLAILSLLLKPDRRTKFWAAVIVVALLLSLGRYLPFSIYKVVYYIPVLNLFRVPARHLMEVHFAIAVLAGRGLTSLSIMKETATATRRVFYVATGIVVLTLAIIFWLRPADFHLHRDVPLTVLRAPELFMPIVIVAASAWVLFAFVRGRRGASTLLLLLLIADLVLWGQFTGWYTGGQRIPSDYWGLPESARLVKENAKDQTGPYRILTTHLAFEPSSAITKASEGSVLWTEPDIYMMYGLQNVAGYDGFGLQRYSELAGDMRLWGEFADPNATLRGSGRELDLLNTRYVVARHERPLTEQEKQTLADDPYVITNNFFKEPSQTIGQFQFLPSELSVPNITETRRLSFHVQPVAADRIALVTNLSFAEEVPDGTVIAKVQVRTKDGRVLEFPLRAGVDTSDWAYDRTDIAKRIKHKRAQVATDYDVRDAEHNYKGHTYVSSIALPETVEIERGEISLEPQASSPGLLLSVFRVSLIDSKAGKTYPLSREMVVVQSGSSTLLTDTERWKLVARGLDVNVYENKSALPRAWLTTEVRVMNEREILSVIRTGAFADGTKWDPLRTALLENGLISTHFDGSSPGSVNVIQYQPNRIDLQVNATTDSILVLSENDYPGWRVTVDGRDEWIDRVNYGLRGVLIRAGSHQVSFVYRPWSVIIGGVISLLTALGLIVSLNIFRLGRVVYPRKPE